MPSLPSQLCKPSRLHRRCPTRASRCATNPTFCNNCCIKATTQADYPSASISTVLSTHSGYYSCVSEGGASMRSYWHRSALALIATGFCLALAAPAQAGCVGVSGTADGFDKETAVSRAQLALDDYV